jgi:hypothetical protein
MTPGFDWDRDVNLPVSGRTAHARHASATGAQQAALGRGPKTRAYLVALRAAGVAGLNDEAAAAIVGVYRTSINSIRSSLMHAGLVEETGAYDVTAYGTKRQRYALTAAGTTFAEGL